MAIYLPPIARKKKVEGWPREDTARVFADLQVDVKQDISTSYGNQFVRHNIPPPPQRTNSANRKNKPQPTAVTFLRQNPRFICEPICHVDTSVNTEDSPHTWWPNETVQRPVTQPQYTFNSTSRDDYRDNSNYLKTFKGHSRYEINHPLPTKIKPATGMIPGCSTPRSVPIVTEKISYEHQYNCRLDPNHPIRGKRHGCFVWKVVSPRDSRSRRSSSNTSNSSERKSVSYELTSESVNIEDPLETKSVVISTPDKESNQTNEDTSGTNGLRKESTEVQATKNEAWKSAENSPDFANRQQHEKSVSKEEFEGFWPNRPAVTYSPPPHTE